MDVQQRCRECGCGWTVRHTCPAPGSDVAGKRGCVCPVLDNCRGRFAPYGGDNWVVRADCPVHAGGV